MAEATVDIQREDDGKKGRFVLRVDGAEAGEMTFHWVDDVRFIIDHTGVDEAYGGKGYARQLVNAGVAYARKHDKKITPHCTYAKRVLESDAQYDDILVRGNANA